MNNAIAFSPLVKLIYFSLAILLKLEGFIELGFFQTPKRDHCVVDFYAIAPDSLPPNAQLN